MTQEPGDRPVRRRGPRRATGGTAPDATDVPAEWARSADDADPERTGEGGDDERLRREVPPHW